MKWRWLDKLRSLFGRRSAKEKDEDDFEPIDFIQHRLELFMIEKKPYLQPRYTITQLSRDIRIPAYQLSAIINHRKGLGFSDYINKLRIQHCESLIKIAGGRNISIQKLAAKCGFQNRNTFTNAFKKFTGLTPSDYIREHW
jgi:YesN/AraC family two-component response regulator